MFNRRTNVAMEHNNCINENKKYLLIKMKTLSVRQPYASLIVEGVKDIENRTWKCPQKYIGERILIHAGLKPANIKYEMEGQATSKEILMFSALNCAEEENLFGYIIGSVQIVDCVINHPSVWAEKTEIQMLGDVLEDIHFLGKAQKPNSLIYNWVLANPIKFPEPIPCKGKLSFWDFEPDSDFMECTNENLYKLKSCEDEIEDCIYDCLKCDYNKFIYDKTIK